MASEKKPIRKALVAIDMSKWAEDAFDWYVSHIHQPHGEVICFHSVEQPWIASGEAYGLAAEAYAQAIETCKVDAKAIEEKFVAKLKQANIGGKVIVRFANRPGEAIVELAQAESVEMIVMGTRGLGTIRRTILGSVSDYVLHHAHCPVVVCNHAQQSTQGH
jgi:nucleotide-binding universal stress UspA family protein